MTGYGFSGGGYDLFFRAQGLSILVLISTRQYRDVTNSACGKPRRSGRGRIARTAQPSYTAHATKGNLRQDVLKVTPVGI